MIHKVIGWRAAELERGYDFAARVDGDRRQDWEERATAWQRLEKGYRAAWGDYCREYLARWPGGVPIGFRRFCSGEGWRRMWMAGDTDACLGFNERTGRAAPKQSSHIDFRRQPFHNELRNATSGDRGGSPKWQPSTF